MMKNGLTLRGPFQLVLLIVITFAASALCLRYFTHYRGSQERGRLIAALLDEQSRELKRISPSNEKLLSQRFWADDDPALRNWLILQAIHETPPEEILASLGKMTQGRYYSPVMKTSIARWTSALSRWGRSRSIQLSRESGAGPDEWFHEARSRYFEARGLQKIGKGYDALPLYLWASDYLTRFIKERPHSVDVPESLFILGSTYMRFRQSFPANVRGDRILNLCAEFFPGSVWSKRSNLLWQEEMKNET